jgi:hypothetical protein
MQQGFSFPIKKQFYHHDFFLLKHVDFHRKSQNLNAMYRYQDTNKVKLLYNMTLHSIQTLFKKTFYSNHLIRIVPGQNNNKKPFNC